MLTEEELSFFGTSIVCPRLDIFDGIQKRLEDWYTVGFVCPRSKESARRFRELFEEHSKTSHTIRSSTENSPRIIYKARLICHHNVKDKSCPGTSRSSSVRDTGCPWSLTMTVKAAPTARSNPGPLRDCGLVVCSGGQPHNHTTETPAALIYRPVSRATEERLQALFALQHGPSAALRMLRGELEQEHGENFHLVACDRSVLPDLAAVFRLYYRIYKEPYRDQRREALTRIRNGSTADPSEITPAGPSETTPAGPSETVPADPDETASPGEIAIVFRSDDDMDDVMPATSPENSPVQEQPTTEELERNLYDLLAEMKRDPERLRAKSRSDSCLDRSHCKLQSAMDGKLRPGQAEPVARRGCPGAVPRARDSLHPP